MNSLSDSSRIAMLVALSEITRFITRRILRSVSTALNDSRRISDGRLEDVGVSDGDSGEAERDVFSHKFSMMRFVQRIEQFNPIHRYLAMGSWLLFSPSILLLCNQRLSCSQKSGPGGAYLSSMVTSLGILFCLYPELSSVKDSINESTDKDTISPDEPDSPEIKLHNQHNQNNGKPPLPPVSIPRKEPELEYRPRSDSLLSQNTESSAPPQPNEKTIQKQYLEILVHNVSHTDLILGLSDDGTKKKSTHQNLTQSELKLLTNSNTNQTTPRSQNLTPHTKPDKPNPKPDKYILCRPRFSAFALFSGRIKSNLSRRRNSSPLISYPRYERAKDEKYTLVTPRRGDEMLLPVGFDLEKPCGSATTLFGATDENDTTSTGDATNDELQVNTTDMKSLRVRGSDISRIDPILLGESPRKVCATSSAPARSLESSSSSVMESLRINSVFFPLLSTLLPRWLGSIADKFGDATKLGKGNVKKVIVLVSGVGSPRNWTHSESGNSTQICSDIMEMFINRLFPDVTVIKIHSQTNIFRYDENISFATTELMPCIDAYRDAHARSEPYPDELHKNEKITDRKPFNPDWRQTVSVAYSFADGSAARTHAIQSALRPYRPTYFHFWQLKTFWHDSKITMEDIEVHSFEEMETVPAIMVDKTTGMVREIIYEMMEFRKNFLESLKGEGMNDLTGFWLRKSRKPVLAVLLVQRKDGEHEMYRGMNMEVSMPTGSLCAERNAIGTALATDPSLRREDLLMVAVLSVQLPPPSPPPGPPLPYCRPTNEGLDDLMVEVSDKLKLQPKSEMRRSTSISSIAEATSVDDWEMDITSPQRSEHAALSPEGLMSGTSTPKHHISLYKFADPKSKAKLSKRHHHLGGISKKDKKRVLLGQSPENINPLRPCGACNEWLKKIAESNPHFKVLTFTDELFTGVYVSPCQE